MDEDLTQMNKDQLLEEVKKLRAGYGHTAIVRARIYVGTIRNFGLSYLRKQTQKSPFRNGRNS